MAVVLHMTLRGLTTGQYEQLKEEVGWVHAPPDGAVSHVVWWEGDDCHGIDVWESQEDWANFGRDRMGPAAAALGLTIDAVPHFFEPHDVLIVKTLRQP